MASSNDRSRRPSGASKGAGSGSGGSRGGSKGGPGSGGSRGGSKGGSGTGGSRGGSKGGPGSGGSRGGSKGGSGTGGSRAGSKGGSGTRESGRGGQGYRERSAEQKERSGGRSSGGAPRKYTKDQGPKPSGRNVPDEPIPGNRDWGGLARKGALRATHDELRDDEEAERRLKDEELDPEQLAKRLERDRRRAERDKRTAALRAEARIAVERAAKTAPKKVVRPKRPKPALERAPLGKGRSRNEDEVTALNRLLGPQEAKKQLRKLRTAADSFEAERYADALKSLKSISELAPSVPEVRELHGLTLYRMGNYKAAAKQLEAFRELAASADQNPVLADCYRAQQRWADVDELWNELADISPGAALVNEGRIVMAGSLADQGDVDAAVRLLQKGWKRPAKPQEHHLRRAYALADLYERSGDLPRARALFDWVVAKEPDFEDARRRLQSLR